jgi:cysteine desulfurase / selenocysteine lyase
MLDRSLYPHADRLLYLDHAATGVLSTQTHAAVLSHLEQRSGGEPNNFEINIPTFIRAQQGLARLLKASEETVEFAPNTSYALNVLAQGLSWKAGDRIAVPDCEFPANVQPWRGLADRGVEVDYIESREGVFSPSDVARALTRRTRVVSISWVQFLSGFRADVEGIAQLCKDRGVLLCVDAIQGVGALDCNLVAQGADFIAGGTPKWLMGMQGLGYFYVAPHLLEQLSPVRGWLNGPVDWDDFGTFTNELHPTAERFRVGTLNSAALIALDAVIHQIGDAGMPAIEERVLGHTSRLGEGLARTGARRYGTAEGDSASGIVTIAVDDPETTFAALQAANVRLSMRNRLLRFAPHAYHTSHEIDHAVAAVDAALRGLTPDPYGDV